MKIVIAPDSFKGSLSAFEAAEAIRHGVERATPESDIDVCALSDGGEGFADVLSVALGGTARSASVTGPLGDRVQARWVMLDDGTTAIIEAASAIGLQLLPAGARAPLDTTTFGIGELIREARSAGARKIIVGLGGTATTDGGAGLVQALGVTFHGAGTPLTGRRLKEVRAISRDVPLDTGELLVLSDVDNPLTGAAGAALTYAPQKGASLEQARELDAALEHLAKLAGDPGVQPGDGAAGGLGYGLRVFAGARVTSGIEFVLDATKFDARLDACNLVITGEGRLDAQSSRGKVVAGVCRRSRARGVPVVALAGAIGSDAARLYDQGLSAAFSLCDGPMSEADAMKGAAALLEALAYNVCRYSALVAHVRQAAVD